MKKLTKKQRHEIYKKAHALTKDGMCGCEALFSTLLDTKTNLFPHYGYMSKIFPEYYLFKPPVKTSIDERWFNGELDEQIKERQIAILFCIEITR